MKKLKILFATLCCALCLCLPLSACNSDLKYYVNGSFKASVTYSTSSYSIKGDFLIEPPDTGEYDVEFVIKSITDGGAQTATQTTNISVETKGEHLISYYVSFNYENGGTTVETVELLSVKLTKMSPDVEKEPRTDLAYGLGFGIPSAVILCGLIVIFVLDKAGIFKKR